MTRTAQESSRDEAARVASETRHDEALVAAAIGGDGLAFEDLVSRHWHVAVRVAAGIVGSNQAEDVVQDALLLAHRALASLKDRTKFSRWLMAITRWRALRVGQQERRHVFGHVPLDESVLETLSDLASSARQSDAGNELLVAALERIPPEYAEVIRYHFLHDLSHQKIAEFLDVPVSTVKWRCYRGKEILRCTLSPEPTCSTVCRKGCAKFPNEK
jgi:RNA polymerase sigma-70 factor (ECF subfamily)